MPQPLPSRKAAPGRTIARRTERSSPRSRGYSAAWDRFSAVFRRRNPFCAWCEQRGRLTFGKVADHKVPVVDGGAVLDPANVWHLCLPHHGEKGRMEAYARERGEIELLPLWCDDPSARPAQFR